MKSPFEDIQFPQYRKYSNNKNFFKINSPKEFEEIQVIGSKKLHRKVVATQFPEMNLIIDLVTLANEFMINSSQNEFDELIAD
ncbi:MAG: hypothetical protein IPG89_04390 [Bacteroidetes bacterium]|nr:hypothetical protein [Bacteroidota bacterium]